MQVAYILSNIETVFKSELILVCVPRLSSCPTSLRIK
jgi:hypothetical protein